MTNEKTFKASNGIVVTISDDGYLTGTWGNEEAAIHATGGAEYGVQALREFFRHERDTELGRVRWPENPDYVIYRIPEFDNADGRRVRLARESTGSSTIVSERLAESYPAVRWYFEEGPGKKPERPWEDAKPGEVWRLTIDGEEGNYLVKAGGEGPQYLSGQRDCFVVDHTRITAGRKLLNADGSMADDQD